MSNEEDNEQDNEQEKKRRKRDSVWDHVKGVEDENYCWCKHCNQKWNFTITKKVETIRQHFGVDKNGFRAHGSGSCRSNPYPSAAAPNSITAHLVAPMSPALQKKFKEEIACFFYESGTPFVKVEHSRLKSTVHLLRSDAILPKRKELGGVMLTDRFNIIQTNVNKHLLEGMGKICITTDGWSTQHRHSLTNYMAVCGGRAFFYNSEMTGVSAHTGEFIAERIAHNINLIGVQRVSGVATDNTAANQ